MSRKCKEDSIARSQVFRHDKHLNNGPLRNLRSVYLARKGKKNRVIRVQTVETDGASKLDGYIND